MDVQRITLNASCVTISGGRTEYLVIIAGFLPRHWFYEWFSQFHSCGTYLVLSRSPSIVHDSVWGKLSMSVYRYVCMREWMWFKFSGSVEYGKNYLKFWKPPHMGKIYASYFWMRMCAHFWDWATVRQLMFICPLFWNFCEVSRNMKLKTFQDMWPQDGQTFSISSIPVHTFWHR